MTGSSGTTAGGGALGVSMAISPTSAVAVTARPPPRTTPSPSQNWGSGAAGSPTARPSVMVAPANFRLTGITESLAVSVTSGPPVDADGGHRAAVHEHGHAAVRRDARAGPGGLPVAAEGRPRGPEHEVAAVARRRGGLGQHAEQRVRVRPAAVRDGDQGPVPGDHTLPGERDAAGDLHASLTWDRNRGR